MNFHCFLREILWTSFFLCITTMKLLVDKESINRVNDNLEMIVLSLSVNIPLLPSFCWFHFEKLPTPSFWNCHLRQLWLVLFWSSFIISHCQLRLQSALYLNPNPPNPKSSIIPNSHSKPKCSYSNQILGTCCLHLSKIMTTDGNRCWCEIWKGFLKGQGLNVGDLLFKSVFKL